jgi:hypothetical protein
MSGKVKEAIEEMIEESYLLGLSEQEIRKDFKRFIDACYVVIQENVKKLTNRRPAPPPGSFPKRWHDGSGRSCEPSPSTTRNWCASSTPTDSRARAMSRAEPRFPGPPGDPGARVRAA